MEIKRALSVRQPFAERIMSGKKKHEERGTATRIRERVYVYASKSPVSPKVRKKYGYELGSRPTGVIVGTVEIVGCDRNGGKSYRWKLVRPKRLKRLLKPRNHPQPVWFYPF